MRSYKTVSHCEHYLGEHSHMQEDERTYCQAAGVWLEESKFITPTELKQKWKGNK
jgi:hypothetical protein